MRKKIIILLVWLTPLLAFAQSIPVTGDVLDEKGGGLGYATVALLHPADSTLAFFGITDVYGHYEIRNTKPGAFLMQVAYTGYKTWYGRVSLPPEKGSDLGAVVMKPRPVDLPEVHVDAERIPLLIKKDTVEYDAAAFKTKPDAVAEDLLRKLPGVEVDRAGNIKAIGEDVKKVLVDGKEFFGNDPKVATKNVPADAVKKVQIYSKKSDESEFTGISDGSHDKTINLALKDDRKKALFGDVMAGGGTGDHYQGSAKAYRFTGKDQFAALGMINNINQFGFSFSDYLNFSGGLAATGGHGTTKIQITPDDNYPVDFGQPVNGYVTSGAAGLNLSHEFRKDNRFYISYLGNAANTKLDQQEYSQNFLPGNSFVQRKVSSKTDENWVHRLNLGWKNRIDSSRNLLFSGNASFTRGRESGRSLTRNYMADSLISWLNHDNSDRSDRATGNFSGSYIHKLNGGHTNIKVAGSASYSYGLTRTQWDNLTHYFGSGYSGDTKQYQDNRTDNLGGSASVSLTQKLGKSPLYLEPEMEGGYMQEKISREQGIPGHEGIIDSLSPGFTNRYYSLRPSVGLRRSTKNLQLSFLARIEMGRMENRLNGQDVSRADVCYFTPLVSVESDYGQGKRIAFIYSSSVNTPGANQLLPVVNNLNPLLLTTGNRSLKPEYAHEAGVNWLRFDQFSFTSLFASLDFTYTHNKIGWARTVNDSLGQALQPVNVPDDYFASASIDYSVPVRKLGLTFHTSLREGWERGITLINRVENINTNLSHRLTVSFDNRRKEKWDVSFGATFSLTDARYSLMGSLNNRYFDLACYGDIRFTPNERWSFAATADVTSYNARTFHDMVSIPLIGAEATFYFLKNNRGMLTLSGADLLNRNTGIERVSRMNYLMETRSNIIGRYVMLSFKYRLNKFKGQSGLDIKMNRH